MIKHLFVITLQISSMSNHVPLTTCMFCVSTKTIFFLIQDSTYCADHDYMQIRAVYVISEMAFMYMCYNVNLVWGMNGGSRLFPLFLISVHIIFSELNNILYVDLGAHIILFLSLKHHYNILLWGLSTTKNKVVIHNILSNNIVQPSQYKIKVIVDYLFQIEKI